WIWMATAKWKSSSARVITKAKRPPSIAAIRKSLRLYFLSLAERNSVWQCSSSTEARPPIKMRTIAFLAPILAASSFVSSLQAKDVIKDKSPDGKFALRLTHGEEGWDTAIIETGTKKKVIDLESVAVSGDKDRTNWMMRGGYQSLKDY